MKKILNEKNLSNELGKIVNEYVTHYKEDLNYDLEVLLDKNKATDTFIFLVRSSGTHLYEKAKLFIEEAGERAEFLYFGDAFLKAFEVNVARRGTKYSHGTVQELKLKSLVDEVSQNSNSCEKVSVRIIKHDDTIVEDVFYTEDSYHKSLSNLKLTYEDVKKFYYLKFFN